MTNRKHCLMFGLGLLFMAQGFGGCTLSEPSEQGIANGRLSTITSISTPFYRYVYDSQGKVTEIGDAMEWQKITVSYASNKILIEYIGWGENGKDEFTESETWDNWELNSQGFIESATITRKIYDSYPGYEYQSSASLDYDKDGHLLYMKIEEIDSESADYYNNEKWYSFKWEDDLLISRKTSDGETYSYTYTSLPNKNGLWIPMWDINTLFQTGLFGVAPGKLIYSSKLDSDDYFSSNEPDYYNYYLYDSGVIKYMQVAYRYGGSDEFNFNYKP